LGNQSPQARRVPATRTPATVFINLPVAVKKPGDPVINSPDYSE
jgi:hypothetical protein